MGSSPQVNWTDTPCYKISKPAENAGLLNDVRVILLGMKEALKYNPARETG
jgi:hypothetical protein